MHLPTQPPNLTAKIGPVGENYRRIVFRLRSGLETPRRCAPSRALRGLKTVSSLGTQPVDAIGNRARLRQDRAAGVGQLRFARRLAVEGRDPELSLEIGNRIADHRRRP